jgi:hypothetical protein
MENIPSLVQNDMEMNFFRSLAQEMMTIFRFFFFPCQLLEISLRYRGELVKGPYILYSVHKYFLTPYLSNSSLFQFALKNRKSKPKGGHWLEAAAKQYDDQFIADLQVRELLIIYIVQ